MPHIMRKTRAPPASPGHTAARSILTLARSGRSERCTDAASGHRSGQEKYNQVQDPKQVERGGIRTRNCCINVNYEWQMCRERDCREGMAVEPLNKRLSVEWWMSTPDRTIQRVAGWPTDDNGAWGFHKKTGSWNKCLLWHKNDTKIMTSKLPER